MLYLPEKSWFGDFNIFFDEPSHFLLEAKQTTNLAKGNQHVEILKINCDTLKEISLQYPEWRKFLALRAIRRRAYFMTQLDEIKD